MAQSLASGSKRGLKRTRGSPRKLTEFSFENYRQKGNFISNLARNLKTGLFKLRNGETIKLSQPTMTLLDNSVQNSMNGDYIVDGEDAPLVPPKRLYKIGSGPIPDTFAPHIDEEFHGVPEISEGHGFPPVPFRPYYGGFPRGYFPRINFRRYRQGLILPVRVVMRRLKKIKFLKKLLAKRRFIFKRKRFNKSKKVLKLSYKLFKLLLKFEKKFILKKFYKKYFKSKKEGKENQMSKNEKYSNPFSKFSILKKALSLIKKNKAGSLFAGLIKSGKVGAYGNKGGYANLIGIAKFYKNAFKAVKRLYNDREESNKQTPSKDGKPSASKPKIDFKKKVIGGTLKKVLTNQRVADTIADIISSNAVKKILAIKVNKDPEPVEGVIPKKSSPGILEKVMKKASKIMSKDDLGEIFEKIGGSKVWTRKTLARLAILDKEKAEKEKAEQEKELASKGVSSSEQSGSISASTPTPTTVESTPAEASHDHQPEPQAPKTSLIPKVGLLKALADPEKVTNAFQRVAKSSFWKKLPGIFEKQKKRFGINTSSTPASTPSEESKPALISPDAASIVQTEVATPIPGVEPVKNTPTSTPVETPAETPKPDETPADHSQHESETPVTARRLLSRSSRRY